MDDRNYIYAQAKIEYTKQLIDILKDNFFDKFIDMYKKSKEFTSEKTFQTFRKKLEEVPEWNQVKIDEEAISLVNCDWFEDLITAVYLTHTKILLSVGKQEKQKKIDLVIPKTNNFIHRCYISIARELWKNPYLYEQDINATEYQRNIQSIEKIISDKIEHTVRSSLPVKDILKGQLESTINPNSEQEREIQLKKDLYNELKQQEMLKQILQNQKQLDEQQDYMDEPSEEQIRKQTQNIHVNDDLLKQDKEEHYDNPHIFKDNDSEKSENYLQMLKKEESENNYYTGKDYSLQSKQEVETINPIETSNTVSNTDIVTESVTRSESNPEPEPESTVEIVEPKSTVEVLEPKQSVEVLEPKPSVEVVEPEPIKQHVVQESDDIVPELPTNEKKITFVKDNVETDTLDNFFDDLQEMTQKENNYRLYDK
jgi:hypothetical protein